MLRGLFNGDAPAQAPPPPRFASAFSAAQAVTHRPSDDRHTEPFPDYLRAVGPALRHWRRSGNQPLAAVLDATSTLDVQELVRTHGRNVQDGCWCPMECVVDILSYLPPPGTDAVALPPLATMVGGRLPLSHPRNTLLRALESCAVLFFAIGENPAVRLPPPRATACPQGHPLTPMADRATSGVSLICDRCDRTVPKRECMGCRPCDYDICGECEAADQAFVVAPGGPFHAADRCPSGHPLRVQLKEQYRSHLYGAHARRNDAGARCADCGEHYLAALRLRDAGPLSAVGRPPTDDSRDAFKKRVWAPKECRTCHGVTCGPCLRRRATEAFEAARAAEDPATLVYSDATRGDTCLRGHPLVSMADGRCSAFLICDRCGEHVKKEACVGCRECDFDLCRDCVATIAAAGTRALRCPHGHALRLVDAHFPAATRCHCLEVPASDAAAAPQRVLACTEDDCSLLTCVACANTGYCPSGHPLETSPATAGGFVVWCTECGKGSNRSRNSHRCQKRGEPCRDYSVCEDCLEKTRCNAPDPARHPRAGCARGHGIIEQGFCGRPLVGAGQNSGLPEDEPECDTCHTAFPLVPLECRDCKYVRCPNCVASKRRAALRDDTAATPPPFPSSELFALFPAAAGSRAAMPPELPAPVGEDT